MSTLRIVSFLSGAAALFAQSPPQFPARPTPVGDPTKRIAPVETPPAPTGGNTVVGGLLPPDPATAHPAAFPSPPTTLPRMPLADVIFDDQGDATWAAAATWKASFDGDHATFVPFFGAAALCDHPVDFRLGSITLAGSRHDATTGTVTREGDTVRITRDGVVEEYTAGETGIEQRFVFPTLARRGELVVDLTLTGDLAAATDDGGVRFANDLGSFRYGKAIAIDGAGRRVDVAIELTAAGLRLSVPSTFVATAELPLVIDPLIGNVVTVAAPAKPVLSSDIAYDSSLGEYVVCWEQQFSQTDLDVWVQRLDDQMVPIGTPLAVDFTTTSWAHPRVAGLNAYNKFLVVAECTSGATPNWIGGRVFDGAAGTFGAQVTIFASANRELAPDVGGDPTTLAPTFFAVVWEHEWGPTDHDIYEIQVTSDGTVLGSAQLIDNSLAFEHSPRISKCNGNGNFGTQSWAVAYRRDQGTLGQTRVAVLSWNGSQYLTNMALTAFAGPSGPVGLAVSSPTDEAFGRVFLVADTLIDPATQNRYLRGTAVSRDGVIIAADQQISFPDYPDSEPQLDCDGMRFGFTFREGGTYSSQVNCVLDIVGSSIVRPEAIYAIQVLGPYLQSGGIVARHSGGAVTGHERQYAVSWLTSVLNQGAVYAQRYLGMGAGGWSARPTACGTPMTWSATGAGAIGETQGLQLLGSTGIGGWVFGLPINVPLPQCPGCILGTTADSLLIGTSLTFQIPADTQLVGATVALQGLDLSNGPCLFGLSFSDTADLMVR